MIRAVKDKPLRFAAFIRVSTEKQEKQGESLQTQSTQLAQAVEALGGKITARYGGQEHATPGWEKKELDKLLAHAAKSPRPFDAVMVFDPSRWSRDNIANATGLEVLRDSGVRFFCLTQEYDLFEPTSRMFLSMHAAFAEHDALLKNLKSIEARIHRAKRGVPTGGNLPFGRIWLGEGGGWKLDEEKLEMVQDCAERYLAGESLTKLAKEYRVNHSNLCKILRERCGDQWVIDFKSKKLNIHERVNMTVPRLLPETTIRAIHARLKANATYLHGSPKNEYLLAGRVFCEHCGYSLYGATKPNGNRFYCHPTRERGRKCPLSKPHAWVRADVIEEAVIGQLFDMFGNPAAIELAVQAAVPDGKKTQRERTRLEAEIGKIEQGRNRVLDLIERDSITIAQADKKLSQMKDRETTLREGLEKLLAKLASSPGADFGPLYVEHIDNLIVILDDQGNTYAGGNDVQSYIRMTDQDRRDLVKHAFGSPLPDGSPAGVRIRPVASGKPDSPKQFTYVLHGRLLPSQRRETQYARRAPRKARRS